MFILEGTGNPVGFGAALAETIHEGFFFPKRLPSCMFIVWLVAACCWASVAFASACRFWSFLLPFFTSTSGARSPIVPGVPDAGVVPEIEPDRLCSLDRRPFTVRLERFEVRSSSTDRSLPVYLRRTCAVWFGKAIVLDVLGLSKTVVGSLFNSEYGPALC